MSRRDYADDAFIEAVEELAPIGTQGVADYVGCTRQNARLRLLSLHEQGHVDVEEIGQAYVWNPVDR